ncbi:hypothetical protein P8605_22930, partial [Streptomyces sp. T-3]|nr:hypothetical protein [Streptomyces sp. T-3]
WHPADAEAARSEIDEFEAAVRRAERDSGPEPDRMPGRHGVPEHSSTPRTRPPSPEGMSE